MGLRQKVVLWTSVLLVVTCGLFPPWLEETNYRIESDMVLREAAYAAAIEQKRALTEDALQKLAREFVPTDWVRTLTPNEAHFTRPLGCGFIFDPPAAEGTKVEGARIPSGIRLDGQRLLIEWTLVALVGASAWFSLRVQGTTKN